MRPAVALCLDATFGARRFSFPPVAEALAEVRRLVLEALARGGAPLVLVEAPTSALAVAATLVEAGVPVRAARGAIQAAAAYARAGLAAPPLQRFDGKLRPGEALLWPPSARAATGLGSLEEPVAILVSGHAADPRELARAGADHEATGASEVGLSHAPGDELAEALRARGVETYPLGPPRQISLFAAGAETTAHVVSAG